MKCKIFAGILVVAAALFSSCIINLDGDGIDSYSSLESNLRGTWVSNDPSIFSGTLVIDYKSIKITGYYENQTPLGDDDGKRPFRNFTKGTVLTGYSKDGEIIIKDFEWQPGIAYKYSANNTYPKDEFLRFTFGGRQETLIKTKSGW